MTKRKRIKGKMENKTGFGLQSNLSIGQLVSFNSGSKREKGIVRCIHPFGKIGTVYVGEFNGKDGYILPVEKVRIV
jgi:hypothetical protein